MRKINEKIVPMNVASISLDFVMDSEKTITCIVKHPSGAILDLTSNVDSLSDSITEIVKLAITEMTNLENNNHE